MIIDRQDMEEDMVEVDGIRMNWIWFTDDSILAVNSLEEAKKNIWIVRKVSRTFRLEKMKRKVC